MANNNIVVRIHQRSNKSKFFLLFLVVVVIAVALFAYHENKSAKVAPAASGPTATVDITAAGFNPSTLSVKAGTKVTWDNTDSKLHQIIANNSQLAFSSPELESGQIYTYDFVKVGTFSYHDQDSPTTVGSVVVSQ